MDDTGAPKLDPRSHDDVIAQTEALATAFTADSPGGPWRPRGDGTLDFGGTLIRLFGGMVDHLITQLNQAPDKHRLAFTGLIGARRIPPRPARAPVTFIRAAGDLVGDVPAGAELAATGAEGPVVFETELALSLTRARLAAVFVRDVAGAGGYANQTAIATGKTAGAFAALGDGQPIEHLLYVAVDDLVAIVGAGTLTVVLDSGGPALPGTAINWQAQGAFGWVSLPPVTVTSSKWTLAAPASAIGPVTVSGVKARWLRGVVPAGSPSVAITEAVAFSVPTAAAVAVDGAYSNGQPVDFTRDILPFGERPRFNDTFYLASDAAFAVANTAITIAFTFTHPPGGVNISSNPTLQWETWDGQVATSLGTTTSAGVVSGLTADTTKAFSVDAASNVTFTLPAAIPRSTVGTVTSRWVRVRLIAGDYGKDITVDNTNKIIPPTFSPPSISSMRIAWTGGTAAHAPAKVIRQTAQTYKFFTGPDAAAAVPIYVAAPELAYQDTPDTRSSLQLGFDRAFEPVLTTLYVQVFPPLTPIGLVTDPLPSRNPPKLAWEYWNGDHWTGLTVEDGTEGLSRSGLVRFLPPADARSLTQFGRTLYWLRARALDLAFTPMPQLGRVLVNTVWASHAHTSALEVLGGSNGARDQQFTLAKAPVLDGQRIEIGEPEAPRADELTALQAVEGSDVLTPDAAAGVTWVRWHEVPDFWASGPRDRHYVLDAETGTLTFGSGTAGMIPPTGTQNIRAASYRAGGGTAGNVAPGAIAQLKTSVAGVQQVTNHEPAIGGAAIEPELAMLQRAARVLRHGGRAVTAQDFADLALESTRAVARATTVTPSFSPINQGNGPLTGASDLHRDGQVVVVIVPSIVTPGAAPSVDLCAEVEDYLRARCAPDARVTVIGPSWVGADIAIHVAATSLERSDGVLVAARAAVAALLDPLTGGDGTGWPFGRRPHVSDVVALISRLGDVDHVSSVTIACDPPFNLTDPQPDPTPDTLSLYDRLLVYARSIIVTASQPQVSP